MIKLVISYLVFAETFVDDMFNVEQIRTGAFTLVNSLFDPMEIFSFIINIFEPLLKAKKLNLVLKIVKNLKLPKSHDSEEEYEDDGLLLRPRR